jgi:hypothetical protein
MIQVGFSGEADLSQMNLCGKDISLFEEFYIRIGIIGS